MKIRKTLDIERKALLYYRKQAAKTTNESPKSLMEKDLLLIANGAKIISKN